MRGQELLSPGGEGDPDSSVLGARASECLSPGAKSRGARRLGPGEIGG